MLKHNKIYCGHVLDLLREIPDESIDCVITSPPYWALRDYGTPAVDWGDWIGELGLEPTFGLFIKHLCSIFDEVKRVLKKTGTCWVNIGDTYRSSGNAHSHTDKTKNVGGKTSSYGAIKGVAQGLMPKSLIQIPSRFAIEMCNPNWVLREDLTYEEKQYVIIELVRYRHQ